MVDGFFLLLAVAVATLSPLQQGKTLVLVVHPEVSHLSLGLLWKVLVELGQLVAIFVNQAHVERFFVI